MFKLFLIFFVIGNAFAMTEQELKAAFIKLVMKCMKSNPVPISELIDLQKLIPPKNAETKCLLACAYRMDGLLSKDGFYDIDHGYKVAELTKNGDEKRLENGRKIADICVKVNQIKVSDPEKGCERATLIFKCVVENAPKFGFKV